jgi:hypothetical protein
MPLFVLSQLFLSVLHARCLLVESKRRLVTVAQLAEHRVVVPKVAGSSPVGHPGFYRKNVDSVPRIFRLWQQ